MGINQFLNWFIPMLFYRILKSINKNRFSTVEFVSLIIILLILGVPACLFVLSYNDSIEFNIHAII